MSIAQLSSRQPLILYGSHPDFEQTHVVSGFLGERLAASPNRAVAAS
jgi:hypothetical protein